MSNIYIQEPPTNGKVLLKTTVGDIDVELWSKEAPLACRNFVQLCLEGYYDDTIFHRVVKGFIAQGGDPTGTGMGGESIYGEPFKDEIHSRLRFNRRGLVAMANAGKNDNGSQFFFTLGDAPELQKKHTIFGKVAGKTIYNMIKLEDGEIGEDDRPVYPNNIISTEILNNPFPDIIPRESKPKKISENDGGKKAVKAKAVKDFKLLSFGEEAEDDEEEIHKINKNFVGKTKHVPGLEVLEDSVSENIKRKYDESESDNEDSSIKHAKIDQDQDSQNDTKEIISMAEKIRKKLNPSGKMIPDDKESSSKLSWDEKDKSPPPKVKNNLMIDEYNKEKDKYSEMKKKLPKKGNSREKQTLEMLMKFRQKINKLQVNSEDYETDPKSSDKETDGKDWLTHSLKCEDKVTLAKDANVKGDDWFEITDPRNTLNKRRRENSKFSKVRIKEELK
ncbi:spliceosome-associated protein CWC27 homolog [Halyomorpha halys]|uniref:spliceosome-associated protein CWC27 homolog n=1 Tax=Halyomorpha halys TaxID=286706 RepID=UPI0006D4CABE|nr:peptidyl-prolyl cis-trans isomerase CWC27 homolog [Halyomorpha halys]